MAAVAQDVYWMYGTSTYTQSYYPLAKMQGLAAIDRVGEAISINAAGVASNVSPATRETAGTLLLLLADKPNPEITVETSGAISLEWYKDRHHVVVITVDGTVVRWAAMLAPGTPAIAGAEPFTGQVPAEALQAIDATI
jgi:hypothetical protein